jgi:DNA-binding transcriptional regulator YiaG
MPQPLDISPIDSIEAVFGIWKSLAQMARDLEVEYYTVTKWWQRRRIPNEAWDAVIAAAARKGASISAIDLNQWNTPRGTANQVNVVG